MNKNFKLLHMKLNKVFYYPLNTGILLILCVAIGLTASNSTYGNILVNVANFIFFSDYDYLSFSLVQLINDGLLSFFFLLIGLEVKKEFLVGELKYIKNVLMALYGAIGGVILPAIIYSLITYTDPMARMGWGIPCATDIAFSIGILSILGGTGLSKLKMLLITIAIFDDIFAILILVFFYSNNLAYSYLVGAFFVAALLFLMNLKGVQQKRYYLLLGGFLWVFMLKSGIHPTISGIMIGLSIPYGTKENSPLLSLEHILQPWINYMILPIFAFFNSIIPFDSFTNHMLFHVLPIGIMTALVIGKPVGVSAAILMAIKFNQGKLPTGTTLKDLATISILCGIGFTMSIFIGMLAFKSNDPSYLAMMRLGVLTGSFICILLAFLLTKNKWGSTRD